MADFHASTKPLSRSAGRSAVAAMSYRTGTVLVDERTGLVHDYTRRGGVEHAAVEVVVPRGCRTFTREALWNAAERAEQRKDARTAREWELALPCELSKEQRIALVQAFAEELAKRYGTAVDYALHEPSKRGDQRNYHAHVMMTTRQVRDGALQEKALLEWNDKKLAAEKHAVGRKQVEEIRELWAGLCNQALERAGCEERVDHRSLKVQQAEARQQAEQLRTEGKEPEAQLAELRALELERTPQTHVGWQATAMDRDGKAVERAELRLTVQREREERRRLVAQLKEKIEQLWAQTKAMFEELVRPETEQAAVAETGSVEIEATPVVAETASVPEPEIASPEPKPEPVSPEPEIPEAAPPEPEPVEDRLPEWLMQLFADKTLREVEREIERVRSLANATPSSARMLYEMPLGYPTSKAEKDLEGAEAEVRKVVAKWQKRREEIEQRLTGAAVLKAHDKGWKKDKELTELEEEHATKMKAYKACEAAKKQAEERWQRHQPECEQEAERIRERIERAKRELAVIKKHEGRLREMGLEYQQEQREGRSQKKEREPDKSHGR